MSGKKAKLARKLARTFEPKFDEAFRAQQPRPPLWRLFVQIFVPTFNEKWAAEWKAKAAPANEAYKRASLKDMSHQALNSLRGRPVR